MSVRPVVEDQSTVDEDIPDALSITGWIEIGGPVDDAIGIEDGDIVGEARSEPPAVDEAGPGGVL